MSNSAEDTARALGITPEDANGVRRDGVRVTAALRDEARAYYANESLRESMPWTEDPA